MNGSGRTVAITGANGFVGRHLCLHFRTLGWEVRGLVRDPGGTSPLDPAITLYRCRLPDEIDPAGFHGIDVLIHCAYVSRFTSLEEARRVNEDGTERVLALTRRAGAKRFVFVSSTSAHGDALSYYGKSKLALEERLDLERDLVLRPGLVLGTDGGLFQRLTDTLGKTGLVPVFGGGRQPVQTVHVDDLCVAMERAIDRDLTGRYVVAEPEGMPLRDLFRLVGRKLGRRVVVVPLPAAPVLALLRAAESLRIKLPISSENVLGALALRAQPSSGDLDAIGVTLRPASDSVEELLGSKQVEGSGPDAGGA